MNRAVTTGEQALGRVLSGLEWRPLRDAYADRVSGWIEPHLQRRRDRRAHPVEDFLFTYYSYRPAALQRWHPGFGTVLEDAEEYAGLKGYEVVSTRSQARYSTNVVSTDWASSATVPVDYVVSQRRVLQSLHTLLTATANRVPGFGCFGLHEWAMVYRLEPDAIRHSDWPLRLGSDGTNEVVDSHRIGCSHFDAFRFFTAPARPLNLLQPARDDRPEFEQPGCLHAGMDLYKHAFRLSPMIESDFVADCFALAKDIRTVDMQASPYDLSALGYEPIRIETAAGKQQYVDAQRSFAERGAPLRGRLIEETERLLALIADR